MKLGSYTVNFALALVAIVSATSCISRTFVPDIYIVVRPELSATYIENLAAIAMKRGLTPHASSTTSGDGDTLRLLEANGRGVRLWTKNVHLSSREKAADCSHRDDARPDPGQFYIAILSSVPFLFENTVEVVRSEIVSDLEAKGYMVREGPTYCGVVTKTSPSK